MHEADAAVAAWKWIAGGMAASYLPIAYGVKWVFGFFSGREQKQIDPLISGQKELAEAVQKNTSVNRELVASHKESNELEKIRQAVNHANGDRK